MLMRLLVQTILGLGAMLAVLLLAGGDWRWPQAWVLTGEVGALSLAMSLWLLKHDPELLKARLTSPFAAGQRTGDRAIMIALGVIYIGWTVLMGLDARRYMWNAAPLFAQVIGAALVGLGMVLVWETFRANSFAAPQVRIQGERGQKVITGGPYRYIRHPMYAGATLYVLGSPLVVGSLWGLVGSVVLMLGVGLRAVREEALLRRELPGYEDYMKTTPWRIVPGMW